MILDDAIDPPLALGPVALKSTSNIFLFGRFFCILSRTPQPRQDKMHKMPHLLSTKYTFLSSTDLGGVETDEHGRCPLENSPGTFNQTIAATLERKIDEEKHGNDIFTM